MLNKLFGSIDFGKLTVDAIPGFISGVAALLMVDAFTPGHLAQEILNDKPAGILVIESLMVVVASYAFGLLTDTTFHTFGRWFASKFWKPLRDELDYRNSLMENLGLSKAEFEWVQSKDADKVSDVETKYMRYTEVAGSAAYATMLLASVVAPFLAFEYRVGKWPALVAAGVLGAAAIALILTSSAALAKYERNKTASAMDEIRGMSSSNLTRWDYYRRGASKTLSRNALWLLAFVIPVFIIPLLVIRPWAQSYPNLDKVIAVGAVTSDNTVPTLEFAVIAKEPNPDTVVNSVIVPLVESVGQLNPINGADRAGFDLVELTPLPLTPPWHLKASLGQIVQPNDSILLTVAFYSTVPVYTGTWRLPVMVDDGRGRQYLLAYVKVTISPGGSVTATATASNTTTTTTEATGDNTTTKTTTVTVSGNETKTTK